MRMQDLLSSNHISSKVHKEEAQSAEETKPLTLAGSSSLGPEDMGGDSNSPRAEASSISPAGEVVPPAPPPTSLRKLCKTQPHRAKKMDKSDICHTLFCA